ncbi:MAG: hypothetical protein GX442_14835 [Candidatus Riflebacteria bacterium]|nr:hypothetical protein [Candidatus Riflebacteria bacterium]
MTSRVRRLWVANVEEVFAPRGPADDGWLLPKLEGMAPRFPYHLAPGDALLVSHPVPAEVRTYVRQVGGFGKEPLPVLVPGVRPSPWFLAEAVQADQQLFAQVRALVATGAWRLEPYLETPLTHRLGEALGIPGGRSPRSVVEEGLPERVNDKHAFKKLARAAGLPVIPGTVAGSAAEARKQTFRLPPGPDGRLMLRRTQSGGGLGNLAGDPESLRDRLPGWFRPGLVLIEPLLPFNATIGVVVEVGEEGCACRGTDEQAFDDGRWVGFRAPATDAALAARAARDTGRLAEALRAGGVRGYLNLDWGVIDHGGHRELVAIEANFRHNGLAHILDWGRACFGPVADGLCVWFLENAPVAARIDSLPALLAGLAPLRLDGIPLLLTRRGGADRGVTPILPPRDGRAGVAVFGPDHAWVGRAWDLVKKALA